MWTNPSNRVGFLFGSLFSGCLFLPLAIKIDWGWWSQGAAGGLNNFVDANIGAASGNKCKTGHLTNTEEGRVYCTFLVQLRHFGWQWDIWGGRANVLQQNVSIWHLAEKCAREATTHKMIMLMRRIIIIQLLEYPIPLLSSSSPLLSSARHKNRHLAISREPRVVS